MDWHWLLSYIWLLIQHAPLELYHLATSFIPPVKIIDTCIVCDEALKAATSTFGLPVDIHAIATATLVTLTPARPSPRARLPPSTIFSMPNPTTIASSKVPTLPQPDDVVNTMVPSVYYEGLYMGLWVAGFLYLIITLWYLLSRKGHVSVDHKMAERYRKSERRCEELELKSSKAKAHYETHVNDISGDLEMCRLRNSQMEAEAADTKMQPQRRVTAISKELDECKQSNRNMQAQSAKTKIQHESDVKAASKDLTQYRQRNSTLQSEAARSKVQHENKLKAISEDLEKSKQQNRDLAKETAAQNCKHDAQDKSMSTELQDTKQKCRDLKQKMSDAKATHALQLERGSTELQTHKQQNRLLQQSMSETKESHKAELETVSRNLQNTKQQLHDVQQRMTENENNYEQVTEKFEKLHADFDSLTTKLQDARIGAESLKKRLNGACEELTVYKSENQRLLILIPELEKNLAKTIEQRDSIEIRRKNAELELTRYRKAEQHKSPVGRVNCPASGSVPQFNPIDKSQVRAGSAVVEKSEPPTNAPSGPRGTAPIEAPRAPRGGSQAGNGFPPAQSPGQGTPTSSIGQPISNGNGPTTPNGRFVPNGRRPDENFVPSTPPSGPGPRPQSHYGNGRGQGWNVLRRGNGPGSCGQSQ